MQEPDATEERSAAERVDDRIAELADWRGQTLARMRRLIKEADPDVVEEVKWVKQTSPGTPTWSHDGIVCTGETYKSVVKLTFAKGASLDDPARLFNASLEGSTRRAIDIREGEEVDAGAFKALVRAAVALNTAGKSRGRPVHPAAAAASSPATKVPLLAGGNPQIARADGDAPVQAYISAMPGWKSDLGRRLDALVTQNVPEVRKAVKWNSPFYGVAGQGWFLSFHVFARYVKVTFFRGTSLQPVPPGGTNDEARWLDVHEDDLDEEQMASWVRQAAGLPGWGKS